MLIESVQVVIAHDISDDLILRISAKINDLKNKLGANIQFLNVPENAPPDAPRVIAAFENVIFQYALNRTTVIFKNDKNSSPSLDHTLEGVISSIEQLKQYLAIEELGYIWLGIIVPIQHPIKDLASFEPAMSSVVKSVYDTNFIPSNMINFMTQIGKLENGFYINTSVGVYESRKIEVFRELKHNEVISLNADEFPITGKGIQIIIDINNRPGEKSDVLDDIKKIRSLIKTSYLEQLKTLRIGEEFL